MNIPPTFIYPNDNDPSKINKFVNRYCSETLRQLSVDAFDENLFTGMTKPFEKVEILSVGGEFKTLSSSTLPFVELFPAIRDLHLQNIQIVDHHCIDQKFRHLKSLYVQLCYENETNWFCSKEKHIENLLRKNPQIQTLSLTYCTPRFLDIVNSILPHVTDLTLINYNAKHKEIEEQPDVVFKYVTHFTLFTGLGEVPLSVFFENLKELHIEAGPTTDWFILAERNRNVEKLFMIGGYVDNEQFTRIVGTDSQLVETTLYISENVWDESIINFMKESKRLRKVTFVSKDTNLFDKDYWIELENEWKITKYAFAIMLERYRDYVEKRDH